MLGRKDQVFVTFHRTVDGKFDPMLVVIVFGVIAAVFFIVTLTVPAVMVANDPGTQCGPANYLMRDEQQICSTPRKDTYFARAQPEGAKFVKTYRTKWAELIDSVHRLRTWTLKKNLAEGPLFMPITCTLSVFFDMTINCTGDKCESVKMYILDSSYWKNANKDGYFKEGMYSYRINNFIEPKLYNSRIDSRSTNYLVFANNNQSATVTCVINLDYRVYNLTKIKYITPDNESKCQFDDVAEGELIIQDYDDSLNRGPMMINVTINGVKTRTPVIVALAIIFSLLCILATIITIVFILFMCGKVGGSFGKLINKKFKEREFGFTSNFSTSSSSSSGSSSFSQSLIDRGPVITKETYPSDEIYY